MAMVSGQATSICNHCDRAIPSSNIDLHYAHCVRNLEKCGLCGDMIPKRHAKEHYLTTHAPVSCSLCSEVVKRETLDVQTGEHCSRRLVTCVYCELPLHSVDLSEHQEVCGNRTEYCHLCNKYIRLCNRIVHEAACTGVHDDTAESGTVTEPSRDVRPLERKRDQPPPPPPPQGRPQGLGEKGHILCTIVITGVAVILGSLFFQEKNRQR